MKLNKLFLTVGLMGAVLTSCEKELHKDAELDINVQTNENITFDGKTITVKAGTPITFQLGGENDFLSFYSGEAGKKYEYRDRTEVDPNDIETSKLTMKIRTDYGNTQALDFRIMVSETFEGLSKNNFEADSILAEKHEGWTVLKTREHINNPDKPPASYHGTAVRNSLDLIKLMCDEYDGLPFLSEIPHDLHQLINLLRGQYCRRFVEYEDIGITVEHLEDLDPLLHANRYLLYNHVRIY